MCHNFTARSVLLPMLIAITVTLAAFSPANCAETFAVYRSFDNGNSWQRAGQGLPRSARVNAFARIGTTILAATDQGVFLSGDQGQTWIPSDYKHSARPLCLAATGSSIYVGTEGSGVLASTNSGSTWHSSNAGSAGLTIRSLLATETNLFAGTDRDGVFKSGPGSSWARFNDGLPAPAQVHQIIADDDILFVALYQKGLFRRRNSDATWQRVGDVVPLALAVVDRILIAGHNPGGLHWSSDQGQTWTASASIDPFAFDAPVIEPEGPSRNAPIWSLASSRRIAFAGAANRIFYSTDGRTWKRAVNGLPSSSPGIAFLVEDQFIMGAIVAQKSD